MTAYIVRRLLLMIPTLFGIMLINFIIVQTAPGGPVEQAIANLTGQGADITSRITQDSAGEVAKTTAKSASSDSRYRVAREALSEQTIGHGFGTISRKSWRRRVWAWGLGGIAVR